MKLLKIQKEDYWKKISISTIPYFELDDIKIYLLGTNGWYDTSFGNTICTFIKHDDFNIIIDAGFGINKLDYVCNFELPTYLFISHLHIDHICGLHLLVKFNFKNGLNICLRKGLKNKIKKFLSKDFTFPYYKLPYKCNIIEINKKVKFPFKLKYLPLKHSVPVLGYRFEIFNKIITCIMDSGYCENAVKLSQDADVLIAESAFLEGEKDENWGHLSPDVANRIKIEANAKKLILTHFGADRYNKRR